MLELRDVQAYYGNIQALKGISLNVRAGEIVTLVGSNGAGKSTTLMTISSVVPVRSGSITFQGKDIIKTATDKVVARGITQVPEGRMIFPALTVLENLRMGGYLRKDKAGLKEDEERAFEMFPILKERRKQYGGTLSGGEQQRACIARAIVNNPPLLLADEPTGNLDPSTSWEIIHLLDKINKRNTTVIVTTHNKSIVDGMRKRVVALEAGRIIRDQQLGVYSNVL